MYKLLAGQFDCLSTLSPEELLTVAKALADSYPDNLDNSFVDELCHFAKFADIFKGNIDISTELFLYKLIIDKGVQDNADNVLSFTMIRIRLKS